MFSEAPIKAPVPPKMGQTILRALAYFDIFDYPLSENEIKNFLQCPEADEVFSSAMKHLVSCGVVFRFDQFYSLVNDKQRSDRRTRGNIHATKLLPKAGSVGAFLYKFPYVRGVGISGSLSKNYADKKADFDFFIITKANRLWIARTVLHLFKKITFLLGRQHYYCMNYFIDEKSLAISDENIYTATEIITLLPVAGSVSMKSFFETNSWVNRWFPLYKAQQELRISDAGSWPKRFTEWLFNGRLGDKYDDLLFQWTTRRWEKKEILGRRNSKGRLMNLLTAKHFSKSDPEAFQDRIVASYEERLNQLKYRWPQYFD
jgi:hypothetical protein